MNIQILLLLSSIQNAHGETILLFFFPSYSHLRGTLTVAKDLVARGHVVWNALPTFMANDKRLYVPGVNHLVYNSTDDYNFGPAVDEVINQYFEYDKLKMPFDEVKEICDLILRDKHLIHEAKKIKFDLAILSTIPLARMLTIFAYRLNLPFMYVGPFYDPFATRSPIVLSTFPVAVLGWNPEMDFLTRVINSVTVLGYSLYDPYSYSEAVALYAPEKPYISMESLTAKGLLWLVDMEPLLHYPQALLPNVKFVGSLSASSPQKLPEKYQKFMDGAKQGIVIVSFGSNVQKFPKSIHDRLIEAFKQTNYRYIFKSFNVRNISSEIMLTDWMPQSDILSHPNVKLFITHCGANGQNEAFLNGVPMLGFPMFAEQHFNAERVVYNGFGLKIDLRSFRVQELIGNITELMVNSSYTDKIKRAAKISKLRERKPSDEAVYWIEHVMQYGGEHLRSYCQDMPLYQFLNLDVIGLLLFILHLFVFIIWKVCCCVIRRCCKQSGRKKKLD